MNIIVSLYIQMTELYLHNKQQLKKLKLGGSKHHAGLS